MPKTIPKTFNFKQSEQKWINYWDENETFSSTPDNSKEAYSITIPPPNVTGVLHLGHTLNSTIQDILIRRNKMLGKNTCWVPGCDHASIATEAKVVEYLKTNKNRDKKDLSREEFLKHAFEWKHKYGGVIYDQLKKLGCGVDWKRKTFTMDDHYYNSVISVFIKLYHEGYLYKGVRVINWDPKAKTALSDEEVEHKTVNSFLFYIRYYICDNQNKPTDQYITIATQRPETIMGDTAICVHPKDKRYQHLIGKKVLVPLIHRPVSIITDTYIDKEFGTGALKVTPAHDVNDYNLGKKHGLETIDILDDEGKLNDKAQILIREDRFEARKKIIPMLEQAGNLEKQETYTTSIGYSQRTHVVIEPKISTQWFMKMDDISKKVLDIIQREEIKVFPQNRFLSNFKHWLEEPKDWCISRQLWWGQRIPAYYSSDGQMIVAKQPEEALKEFKKKNPKLSLKDIKQDEDCLDTWFSSWIWPMEVFKGLSEPNNHHYNYFFPTSVLVTAPDILYFWVARMIMASTLLKRKIPFNTIYFTGLIRDEKGRKMSKSLGNSPDLLQLIDKYGADVVRFSVMISAAAGNDLLFSEKSLDQGKTFIHKLWNVLHLINLWEGKVSEHKHEEQNNFAHIWLEHTIRKYKQDMDTLYERYQLNEVLKKTYSLIWNDFCSHYLEWIKPKNQKNQHMKTLTKVKIFYSELLTLLHPFMPFVTNEINEIIQKDANCLTNKTSFKPQPFNENILTKGEKLKRVVSGIRDYRVKNSILNKDTVNLEIYSQNQNAYTEILPLIKKMSNVDKVFFVNEKKNSSVMDFSIDKDLCYILAENLSPTNEQVHSHQQELKKQLEHLKNFLKSIDTKLNNEKFMANAKQDIIKKEKQKKNDTLYKIDFLEKEISKYN